MPEDQSNDDVKAFNDNILFNSRPITPTHQRSNSNATKEKSGGGGLFKLPGWLRGKSDQQTPNDNNKGIGNPPQPIQPPYPPPTRDLPAAQQNQSQITPQLIQQTETTMTPNVPNTISPRHSLSGSGPPPFSNLPPLLQSQTSILGINKERIVMKTIFVPGVPINSVKFNDNGQRLAYSTDAGVIQVYQFPVDALPNLQQNSNNNNNKSSPTNNNNDDKKKEKLSPKLLHTFCVSKPNEILQLCWDTMNDNRLFIAIGNPKKNDDHIQIWNVGDKKCEYIISFGSNNECSCIEYIKCNPSYTKLSDNNRLIVSGYKYKDNKDNMKTYQSILYLYNDDTLINKSNKNPNEGNKTRWNLISKSNMMDTLITCVEFNHNGKIIIVGGNDGYIRIFDIKNGYFTQLTKWNAHRGCIQSIHLCDDANSIISIAKDFIVKHWQLNNNDNSCKKIWRLKDENIIVKSKINDNSNEDIIVPLLCLGPKNFFAVTEPEARLHDNNNNGKNYATSSINEEKENSVNNNDNNNNGNINQDTMIYNVIIKNIDDKNDSYTQSGNNNNNINIKNEGDIIVGGHSKIITAIDWHRESQMLATCSVDGTLRIFEVFRH